MYSLNVFVSITYMKLELTKLKNLVLVAFLFERGRRYKNTNTRN